MISSVDSLSRRIAGPVIDLSRRLPVFGYKDEEVRRGHILDARACNVTGDKSVRLCNTFFLAMDSNEALAALRKLGLERFSLEFVTIPAEGGCVVAVFAQHGAFLSKLRLARQQQDATTLLASIGATVVPSRPRSGAPTVAGVS